MFDDVLSPSLVWRGRGALMRVTDRVGATGAPLSPTVAMATATPLSRTSRLIIAELWVAILAFGVAAAMAMMQAISRANLELPYRSARMYYMSITAHGVLMAL